MSPAAGGRVRPVARKGCPPASSHGVRVCAVVTAPSATFRPIFTLPERLRDRHPGKGVASSPGTTGQARCGTRSFAALIAFALSTPALAPRATPGRHLAPSGRQHGRADLDARPFARRGLPAGEASASRALDHPAPPLAAPAFRGLGTAPACGLIAAPPSHAAADYRMHLEGGDSLTAGRCGGRLACGGRLTARLRPVPGRLDLAADLERWPRRIRRLVCRATAGRCRGGSARPLCEPHRAYHKRCPCRADVATSPRHGGDAGTATWPRQPVPRRSTNRCAGQRGHAPPRARRLHPRTTGGRSAPSTHRRPPRLCGKDCR